MSWFGGIAAGLGHEGEAIEKARRQKVIETLNQSADAREQKEAALRLRAGEQNIQQKNAPEVQYVKRGNDTYAISRDPNTGQTKVAKVEGLPAEDDPESLGVSAIEKQLGRKMTDEEKQRLFKIQAPVPKPPANAQLRPTGPNGELEWFTPPTADNPKGKVVDTGEKAKPTAHRDPVAALQDALAKSDYIAAHKIVNTAQTDTLAAQKLMSTMDVAKDKALAGDQQAQFAITANHILMTAGQKGGRVSQAMYKQAEESAPTIGRIEARWGPDGYLSGVVLTPQQINAMVSLAHEKVRIQQQSLNDTKQTYANDLSLRQRGGSATPDSNDPMNIRK